MGDGAAEFALVSGGLVLMWLLVSSALGALLENRIAAALTRRRKAIFTPWHT